MNSIHDTSLCSHTNRTTSCTFAHLALALLCLPFGACGGSSSSPSAPTPVAVATPQPCAQTVLFQGSGEVPSGTLLNMPVTATAAGRLDVTADWTLTTNPVGLYIAQGACSLDQFNARSCNFLLRVEPGPKPLKGSATVQTGNYTVFMANFGARGDSGTMQIVMSTGSCAAPTAASSEAPSSSVDFTVSRVKSFSP